MAEITLYGLKSCDTCKKAQKALAAAGHDVAFVDVRAEADLAAKLPQWLAAAGADALVNTRSTTWRGLPEAERARAQSDPKGLLADHPALIKRPVIERGGEVSVGWTRDVQAGYGV
ncbi:MAG: ArsC/Spx/MgsR family protein [Oceanicaulis sp.]